METLTSDELQAVERIARDFNVRLHERGVPVSMIGSVADSIARELRSARQRERDAIASMLEYHAASMSDGGRVRRVILASVARIRECEHTR